MKDAATVKADAVRELCEMVRKGGDEAVKAQAVLEDAILEAGGELAHDGGVLVMVGDKQATSGRSFAHVYPGKAICIFGVEKRHSAVLRTMIVEGYAKLFKVGDVAEYDSFNLSYTGPIKSISTKCIVISHARGEKKTSRLDLYTFNWRNRHFDAEETAKKNSEEMNYL